MTTQGRGGNVTPPTADQDAQRQVIHRLRRAHGQLAAIITAVEAGGSCRDVVTQLAAVSSALDKAGFAIIATAMRDCVADPGAKRTDGLTTAELERLFLMLA
jgi:DNA-binding FrmR family transcriptional regulator